jgi:hypothetical protein
VLMYFVNADGCVTSCCRPNLTTLDEDPSDRAATSEMQQPSTTRRW